MPFPVLIARLMVAAGAAAVSYLFVKQLGSGEQREQREPTRHVKEDRGPASRAVRMLLDPQCQTYFPADEAVSRWESGQRVRFCSSECASAYMAR